MSEKRRFARIDLEGRARLELGEQNRPVELLDLSLKGALVQNAAVSAGVGDECRLTLELDDSDLTIPIQARVTHVQEDRLGIEFTQLDVEAMQHIRRMLELNAGRDDLAVGNLASPDDPDER
jgi:hypothetical protein